MKERLLSDFDFTLLNSTDFKEDSVREEIIQPILKKLGYSASGENKILRSKVVSHPFVQVGSGQRQINSFPDYLFQIDDKYAWVLDAKSPDEEIKSGENVEQVYFYAIHPEIRVNFFALCNGKEFILFEKENEKPLLYFHVSEIDRHWKKLLKLLSPEAFKKEKAEATKTAVKEGEFDYKSITPLTEIKVVQKQAAKRHFGVHGYFTKQAWGVVQEYIKNFSQPGDIVLDPFGGGGVTLVEALMLGRKAIHIDLNPLSVFITKNLIEPVNVTELIEEFNKIKTQFEKNCPKTKKEIKEALKKYPYPKDIALPKGSDVETIEALFSDEQLAQLAYLKHHIKKSKRQIHKRLFISCFFKHSYINKFNCTRW